jgi:triacylglycerol lipase
MDRSKEHVILLHGLGETPWQMALIEGALKTAGYGVSNLRYPSTEAGTAELAERHVRPLFERFADVPAMHFVTHSLGGIMMRYLLQDWRPANLGRIVMLAPGHHGSQILELYRRTRLFKEVYGPAGQEVGMDDHCFSCFLDNHVDYELGIVAGTVSGDPLANLVLPWPHDGRLAVESTRIDGMRDHTLVPATHDHVTYHPLAISQVLHFLKHGQFWQLMRTGQKSEPAHTQQSPVPEPARG